MNPWKITTVVLGAIVAALVGLIVVVAHGLAYPDKGKIV